MLGTFQDRLQGRMGENLAGKLGLRVCSSQPVVPGCLLQGGFFRPRCRPPTGSLVHQDLGQSPEERVTFLHKTFPMLPENKHTERRQ